jgi:hypothetical protein
VDKFKSLLQKFHGRRHDLVNEYEISVSHMTKNMFHLSYSQSVPFLIHHLSLVCTMTGITSEAVTAYLYSVPQFTLLVSSNFFLI